MPNPSVCCCVPPWNLYAVFRDSCEAPSDWNAFAAQWSVRFQGPGGVDVTMPGSYDAANLRMQAIYSNPAAGSWTISRWHPCYNTAATAQTITATIVGRTSATTTFPALNMPFSTVNYSDAYVSGVLTRGGCGYSNCFDYPSSDCATLVLCSQFDNRWLAHQADNVRVWVKAAFQVTESGYTVNVSRILYAEAVYSACGPTVQNIWSKIAQSLGDPCGYGPGGTPISGGGPVCSISISGSLSGVSCGALNATVSLGNLSAGDNNGQGCFPYNLPRGTLPIDGSEQPASCTLTASF